MKKEEIKNDTATSNSTAKEFLKRLNIHQSDEELKKIQRYFKTGKGENAEGDHFIGVRMGTIFNLAKEFVDMSLDQVEILLDNPIHEARVGAVSIMDYQARSKKTDALTRKELFELYIKRHDRINNWDLVDRSAIYVVGQYLFDQPRAILYKLAKSKTIWERRTAIVSTAYFIKKGDLDDTFKIAELLIDDKEDLIHKATGWMLRSAGTVDKHRLALFLDKYGAKMPRILLRYSLEHFSLEEKKKFMAMKNQK